MKGSPPIFELISEDPGVVAAFGQFGERIYSFGLAPKILPQVYAVWQVITGSPENYVNQRPDIDSYVIQFDVYGDVLPTVRTAADALVAALEAHGHITAWRGDSTDPETRRGRISFDFEMWDPRT